MFGGSFSQFSVFQLFPFSPLYLMICGAYIHGSLRPLIITSNHYGNSVVKMYREVGAYCIRPLERPAKGV